MNARRSSPIFPIAGKWNGADIRSGTTFFAPPAASASVTRRIPSASPAIVTCAGPLSFAGRFRSVDSSAYATAVVVLFVVTAIGGGLLYPQYRLDVRTTLEDLQLRAANGDITATRRELQREYVNRLAGLVLRPGSLSRADARSLMRMQAQELMARIHAATQRKGLSSEAKAHLQDSADTLRQALTAPLQRAGAYALSLPPSYYDQLQSDYRARRDLILPELERAGFGTFSPDGAYYVMTDISAFGFKDDVEFTRHLIREVGVACVPGSSFYSDPALGSQQVRFCFCKKDETLLLAAERLSKLR